MKLDHVNLCITVQSILSPEQNEITYTDIVSNSNRVVTFAVKVGKTVLKRPTGPRRSRRLQKRKRAASVSSSSSNSSSNNSSSNDEATSNSSSTSDSSSEEEFHDSEETPHKSDDQIEFLPQLEEREILESTTAVSTADVTAQTEEPAAAQTVHTDTQTVFTDYPRFLDNEGEILRQLRNLRRSVSSFQARMSPTTLRGHDEARLEISRLQEKLRTFLQFHRNQITRYLANVVVEGHRNLQKDHLRKKSNEAIMPLLELMDRFKAENLNLGAQYRAPLSAYRKLLEELEDTKQNLDHVRYIDPVQFLT